MRVYSNVSGEKSRAKANRRVEIFVRKNNLKPGDKIYHKFYDYTFVGIFKARKDSYLELYNPNYRTEVIRVFGDGCGYSLKDLEVKKEKEK